MIAGIKITLVGDEEGEAEEEKEKINLGFWMFDFRFGAQQARPVTESLRRTRRQAYTLPPRRLDSKHG
jgi:hypothetical protein